MSIENQIAIQTDEPEAPECPKCQSAMTHNYYAGVNWLICDGCEHEIEEGE